MDDLFKDILKDGESLFLNEVALSYDYMPKNVPYRENEQHYIANCIKPLFQKRDGKNLFLFGKPGIGKTLAIKQIFRELEEKGLDEDVYVIYINCWKKETPHKILLEICDQIGYKFTHNKTTDELMEKVASIINKKGAVFCFDEVDKINELTALYSILEDLYRKTIILITNHKSWFNEIDTRIKSRLMLEFLEFRPYNYNETYSILKERLNYGFVKNVWQEEAFKLIVDKTFELKDIRTGLFLLRESGINAEFKSSKEINLNHTNDAIKKLEVYKIKSSLDIEKDEKNILDLIKGNSGKSSMFIYEIYKKQGGNKSYRTFYRKLKNLEKDNLIKIESVTTESGGQSSLIIYGSLKKLDEFS